MPVGGPGLGGAPVIAVIRKGICDPLPMLSALGRFGSAGVELGRNRGVGEGVNRRNRRHRRDLKSKRSTLQQSEGYSVKPTPNWNDLGYTEGEGIAKIARKFPIATIEKHIAGDRPVKPLLLGDEH